MADLKKKNAVLWMVSTRPLISKSSCRYITSLVTVLRAPITIRIIVTFMLTVFSTLEQGRGNYPFFGLLSVLLFGLSGQQRPQFCKFSFFSFLADFYTVWLSGRDEVILLYQIIPEEFVHLIFLNGFLLLHIFVHMVKFKFLLKFPVNHLAHTVVSSLIFFLC